jgi:hypothetical protein
MKRLIGALPVTLRPGALVIGLIVAAFAAPLLIGIWLPDVFSEAEHTLAEQRLGSGLTVRVVQYWNHVDFYNTELRVTAPDGKTTLHILDADDNKSWRLPLVVDEQRRSATVILGGNRARVANW